MLQAVLLAVERVGLLVETKGERSVEKRADLMGILSAASSDFDLA